MSAHKFHELIIVIILAVAAVPFIINGNRAYFYRPQNPVRSAFRLSNFYFAGWSLIEAILYTLKLLDLFYFPLLFRITDFLLVVGSLVFLKLSIQFTLPGFLREKKQIRMPDRERFRMYIFASIAGLLMVLSLVAATLYYDRWDIYIFMAMRIYLILTVFTGAMEQRRHARFLAKNPHRLHMNHIYSGLLFLASAGISLLVSYPLHKSYVAIDGGLVILILFGSTTMKNILIHHPYYVRENMARMTATTLSILLITPLTIFLRSFLRYDEPLAFVSVGVLAFSFMMVYILIRRFREGRSRQNMSRFLFESLLINPSIAQPLAVRRYAAEFIRQVFRPGFFALYETPSDTSEEEFDFPILDRELSYSVRPLKGPPDILPREIQELFIHNDTETRDGGMIADLIGFAEEHLGEESIRQIKHFNSLGAEIFIPVFDRLPDKSYPDEHQVQGRKCRAVIMVGINEDETPMDYADLRIMRNMVPILTLAFTIEALSRTGARLAQRLEKEHETFARELSRTPPGTLEGFSTASFVYKADGPMAVVAEQLERFAKRTAPLLITGETGTGKEQIARILHVLSGRSGDFTAINCSAIPQDLIENELFGHVKGAYTGAESASEGLVGRAKGGSLFLDEIGDMPLEGQVKLLRLVQEGEYEKIGSDETLKTDTRFIFATNRDLEEEVRRGRFRNDLYYRISTFDIRLPPLRERREDIPLLSDHFLWIARKTFYRPGLKLSPEAKEVLIRYHWPGNVRELENMIMRAVALSETDKLGPDAFPDYLQEKADFHRKKIRLEKMSREQARLEKELLVEALKQSEGNQSRAASLLGISRGALQYRMKQYGVS